MKVIYLKKEDLKFTRESYSESLKSSISRIKIQIALKVKVVEDGYLVIDGHKRMTVINDLNLDINIPCLLINDFEKQGSTYWGSMNHH